MSGAAFEPFTGVVLASLVNTAHKCQVFSQVGQHCLVTISTKQSFYSHGPVGANVDWRRHINQTIDRAKPRRRHNDRLGNVRGLLDIECPHSTTTDSEVG
ncbi:hypothetical protein H257_04810 [Aphanomyces astaci]|uniref:Uncharacterized protein n=1 Tax=Aphanomyces astaci TaxID=112090 RepID=W4GTR9_APHAT|nr:hypothetical protein H257_04810 [Aphanomyces astaci]ETV83072.1 hypothetical protein H257_04810 [Aphanomyces astaci]|eukprot:XP_009827743.1 hypothetical protein H257_04810 [Aphanomyces astaci]